jgi:predicted RecB family nuclease
VIVQVALRDGRWYGRPDVMRRVETPSNLGPWSYEVADTKLARETRAGTILQLGLYSELLGAAQGVRPEYFHVVTPDPEPVHRYRTDDYAAYFRWIRTQMEGIVARDYDAVAAAHYPEPVEHCDVCPWSSNERLSPAISGLPERPCRPIFDAVFASAPPSLMRPANRTTRCGGTEGRPGRSTRAHDVSI